MPFDLIEFVSGRLYTLGSARNVVVAAQQLAAEASLAAGRHVTAGEIVAAFRTFSATVRAGTFLAHEVAVIESSLAAAGAVTEAVTVSTSVVTTGGVTGATAGIGIVPAVLILAALGLGVFVFSRQVGGLSGDRALPVATLGDPSSRSSNPPTALTVPVPATNLATAQQGKVWRLKSGSPQPSELLLPFLKNGTIECSPGIIRLNDVNCKASWVFTELPEKLEVGKTYKVSIDPSGLRMKDPKNWLRPAAVISIWHNVRHPNEHHSTLYVKAELTEEDNRVKNAITHGDLSFVFEPTRDKFIYNIGVNGYPGGYNYEYEPVKE